MSILDRIGRILRGSMNQMLDRVSDPAKDVDWLIAEMERGLREATQEVIAVTADAKRAEARIADLETEADRWQGRAEQAVRAGQDELARQALNQKLHTQREVERARTACAAQRAYGEELKTSLEQLRVRLEGAKSHRVTLKQRAKAAKKGESALAGADAFREFDHFAAQVEAAEDVADLTESAEVRKAAVEARFARLDRDNPEIDDELAALKRRIRQER